MMPAYQTEYSQFKNIDVFFQKTEPLIDSTVDIYPIIYDNLPEGYDILRLKYLTIRDIIQHILRYGNRHNVFRCAMTQLAGKEMWFFIAGIGSFAVPYAQRDTEMVLDRLRECVLSTKFMRMISGLEKIRPLDGL